MLAANHGTFGAAAMVLWYHARARRASYLLRMYRTPFVAIRSIEVTMKVRRPPTAKPLPRRARRARPASGRVRLVVADGQAIDRGGLVGMLEDQRDFEVVGEAATLEEAMLECRALEPDVVLLSLNLPGQEHEAAIPALRTRMPHLRVVALSERGEANCLVLNPPSRTRTSAELQLKCAIGVDCLQLAVTQGAHATVRRSADPEDLFRAIRAVASGSAWYDPTTVPGLVGFPGERGNGTAQVSLTEREFEVAALIAEGQSNKEISAALAISEPTVKKHVGRVLQKLGIADRLQAGLLLVRNPLIFRR